MGEKQIVFYDDGREIYEGDAALINDETKISLYLDKFGNACFSDFEKDEMVIYLLESTSSSIPSAAGQASIHALTFRRTAPASE